MFQLGNIFQYFHIVGEPPHPLSSFEAFIHNMKGPIPRPSSCLSEKTFLISLLAHGEPCSVWLNVWAKLALLSGRDSEHGRKVKIAEGA